MTVEQIKQSILDTLGGMDKDKLNLSELSLYAEILRTVSGIESKDYFDRLSETMKTGFSLGFKPPTISDLK